MTLSQGHISKVKNTVHTYTKLCRGYNSSLPCWILIIYHTIVSWPWLMVLSPRSTVYARKKNCIKDHYLSRVTWMGMILHTIVDHDTGVVIAGGIRPVRTCLVLSSSLYSMKLRKKTGLCRIPFYSKNFNLFIFQQNIFTGKTVRRGF